MQQAKIRFAQSFQLAAWSVVPPQRLGGRWKVVAGAGRFLLRRSEICDLKTRVIGLSKREVFRRIDI